MRRENQEKFDAYRGMETWLLNEKGKVVIENDVEGDTPPRIFNNWNSKHEKSMAVSQTGSEVTSASSASAFTPELLSNIAPPAEQEALTPIFLPIP